MINDKIITIDIKILNAYKQAYNEFEPTEIFNLDGQINKLSYTIDMIESIKRIEETTLWYRTFQLADITDKEERIKIIQVLDGYNPNKQEN